MDYDTVVVTALKYDGRPYRRAEAKVIVDDPTKIVLRVEQGTEVLGDKGTFAAPRAWDWYFWPDQWYTISAVYEPDGSLQCYYCNVGCPIEHKGNEIQYIDLDLDLLVQPDLTHKVLDADEFLENSQRYAYPAEIQEAAQRTIAQLQHMVAMKAFPFSREAGGKSQP